MAKSGRRTPAAAGTVLRSQPLAAAKPDGLTHPKQPSRSAMTSREASEQLNMDRLLNTEWLAANSLGGYAMGTLLGANTRRYHGLFVAAITPPVRRVLALHSIIEQIEIDGEILHLSSQQFGDDCILHPDGHTLLTSFEHAPPDRMSWVYHVRGMTIRKTLSLARGSNLAQITYRFDNVATPLLFRARPLTPLRDFHALEAEGDATPHVELRGASGLMLQIDDVTMLIDSFGSWKIDPQWWRGFAYTQDRSRGQGWREDVWSPGTLEVQVPVGASHEVEIRVHVGVAGEHGLVWINAPDSKAVGDTAEQTRPDVLTRLRLAADQFVASRKTAGAAGGNAAAGAWSTTVIAGYPWFADWGRDTMISLPGLLLSTGRLGEARSALLTFARHLHKGLVPNHFDDYGGAAHYNTVDASLWFVHAVRELVRAESTAKLSAKVDRELLEACRAIIEAYRNGTDHGIRMDGDGLIMSGDENTQLTWMDAKRDGVSFTPRNGKPVEINALWYNGLLALAEMTSDAKERADLEALALRTGKSIRETYWWPETGGLHDVLMPGRPRTTDADGSLKTVVPHEGPFLGDAKMRPNQIFAVSLPHSALTPEQQKSVVQIARERLLTPYGLRTLDRDDAMYRGRYEGDLFRRDAAYHQGTVWPWLIGAYCDAVLRVGNKSAAATQEVRSVLQPLIDELDAPNAAGGCVGQLAEVYDGDPPHRPSGCPAQAWSIAEVLRVLSVLER